MIVHENSGTRQLEAIEIQWLRQELFPSHEDQVSGRAIRGCSICGDQSLGVQAAELPDVDATGLSASADKKDEVPAVRQESRVTVGSMVRRLESGRRRGLTATLSGDAENWLPRARRKEDGTSRFHVPPSGPGAVSTSVFMEPSPISIRLSLASAKKAIDRLSGDQNGDIACSLPGSGRACEESSGRNHN